MINFFRKIRKKLADDNKPLKYMRYAIGEIVLVVIGILIALQINNWNQRKIEEASLTNYLSSISKNIKSDLEKIQFLKTNRTNTYAKLPYIIWTLPDLDYLTRSDIKFAGETLSAISDFEYFNADLSAYESLKNSGYLSKLQGQDLEDLLYKYYNLVHEIEIKEKDYNDILRTSYNNFTNEGFEYINKLSFPDFIGDEEELTFLQPFLKKILFHSSSFALYNYIAANSPGLIVKYENLIILSNELMRMIDENRRSYDAIAFENLNNIFKIEGAIGYPQVIKNAATNNLFYHPGFASYPENRFDIYSKFNEYRIEAEKMVWGVVYFRNSTDAFIERPTRDYSNYKTIKLELKGDKGGETALIALKDATDPDDGSETKFPLLLTNEWEFYEIPLSEFKTADLKNLYIVMSFVFEGDAKTISVRNIEYLK